MKRFYLSNLAILLVTLLGWGVSATAQSSFVYTGAIQTYLVPSGVTSLAIDMAGANGGTAYLSGYGVPGAGGRVQCVLTVSPGQVLNLYVGGVGTNGVSSCCTTPTAGGYNGGGAGASYGGGGGGASDIRIGGTALSQRVVVAGAGGGGGDYYSTCSGGVGGGLTGGNGSSGGGACYYGAGGTQTAGGAAATCYSGSAYAGTFGVGGAAYADYSGGGGGGYYGGGGAAIEGGGGGGSSYTSTLATGVTHTQGYNTLASGNGYINICPGPNTGTITVGSACPGTTATATDVTSSSVGTWSTTSANIVINGTSGVVTGLSPGVGTISYSVTNVCATGILTASVLVNPTPPNPTGNISICQGTTTTLADASTGGTWLSSNTAIATIGASSGVATGVAAGIVAITYTATTGCQVVTSVAVNAPPPLHNVTGGGTYCPGGTGVAIGLNGSDFGITYQLYNGTSMSGTPLAGTGSALNFGLLAPVGTYTVLATNTGSGCTRAMTGSAPVAMYAPLSVYTVTGGGTYCAGGTGVAVNLSNSTPGISYQLYNGVATAGAAVIGTGGTISFGLHRTTGTRTAIATNLTTGCSVAQSGSVTVNINPVPPTNTLTTPDSTTSFCAGGAGVHIGLNGSVTGVSYQLQNGGTLTGMVVPGSTGSPLNFGLVNVAGTYTVLGSYPTGCSTVMAGTATVVAIPLPTAYAVTGGGSYCTGGTGVPVRLSYSTPGTNYQLYNGTTPVGPVFAGTDSALFFGNETVAGTNYHVVATSPASGCTNLMSGSVAVNINALPASETISVAGTGMYCPGTAVPNVLQGSSVMGTSYQLYNGTTAVGTALAGTGFALTFTSPTGPGLYTVVATITATTCSTGMGGTANITTYTAPAAYMVTGGGSFCATGTGVPVGLSPMSDLGVRYKLYDGSTLITTLNGTGGALNFGNMTAAGTYTVVAVDTTHSCVTSQLGNAAISINPLPETFMVIGGGSYCNGGSGKNIKLSYSTPGVSYQLYNDGIALDTALGGTGDTLNFGSQTDTGSYTIFATNTSTGCAGNMTGSAAITINPLPNAYTVSGTGSFCQGGAGLPVGLTTTDGGFSYQLYNGTVAVGPAIISSGGAVSFGLQTLGGTYSVVATNPATMCSNTMSTSATITVNPAPVMHTVTGGGSFCAGSTTGVNIGLDSSDVAISYMLYHGTTLLATLPGTGGSFNFAPQTATGTYTVSAMNTLTGCTGNMSGVATITNVPTPLVYTVTGGGSFCQGGTGAHVNLSSSTSGVNYYLMTGGVTVDSLAGSGHALDFGSQTMTGVYTVSAENMTTGCTSNQASSASITINPLPDTFSVSAGGSYCEGTGGVDVRLTGSNSGISYQLYYGTSAVGLPVTGMGAAVDFGNKTAPGTYTVVGVNTTTGCVNTMPSSAVITMIPTAVPAVTVASAIPTTVCAGTVGNFTATAVNGGTSPVYHWMVNGAPIGTDSAGLAYTPSDGQVITVMVTSNAPCASPLTATSTPITFAVIANRIPSVSLSATSTNICRGSDVFFTATPSYGGTGATFSYVYDNTVISSGSYLTYDALPANGDSIYVIMSSNYPCIIGSDSVQSAHIGISVSAPLDPFVIVTANPGTNIKMGVSVTFTAHATSAGTSPMYQWSVNGVEVPGATNATYTTSSLNNGDNVTCAVTGTNICGTNTASSNQLIMSVENTTGVAVVTASASDVKLLPNPNKGDFMVKGTLGTTGQQEVTIEITNMVGQVVYKANTTIMDGKINEHIQLGSNLANGMYLLNLVANTGNTVFHFVVE